MRKCAFAGLVIVLTLSLSPTLFAAPAFEELAPENALGFATIKNVPQLREQIKQQPFYGIWKEPAVQNFLQKPLEYLNTKIQEGEAKAGFTVDDVWSLFNGQVALMVAMEDAAEEPDILILVDVGDKGESAMTIVSALLQALAEDQEEKPVILEEEFMGVRLVKVLEDGEETAGAAPEPDFSYGIAGDVFIFGSPLEGVKRVISQLQALPPNSLAASASYQQVLNKVSPDSAALAYVNLPRIMNLIQANVPDPQTPVIMNALGLTSTGSAGLGISFEEDIFVSRAFVAVNGAPRGIMKILMPQPAPLRLGEAVPQDAYSYLTVLFDGAKVWDEVERMIGLISPETLAMMNAQINQMGQATGQTLNLRNDVFSLFGPQLSVYMRYEQPVGPNSQQSVIMLDLTSRAAFENTISKVQQMIPEFAETFPAREYMGYKIYEMYGPQTEMDAFPMPHPAFVATDRQLIFSLQSAALESHLRRLTNATPSLADEQDFQEAFAALPAEGRIMAGYDDSRRAVEFMLEMLRQGGLGPLDPDEHDEDVAAFLSLFDFTLLPPADVITRHLTPSASVGIVEPEGLFLISKTMKPKI